jgi:hypothetical protein
VGEEGNETRKVAGGGGGGEGWGGVPVARVMILSINVRKENISEVHGVLHRCEIGKRPELTIASAAVGAIYGAECAVL